MRKFVMAAVCCLVALPYCNADEPAVTVQREVPIKGEVRNYDESFKALGIPLGVELQQISYRGKTNVAKFRSTGKNKARVELTISDVSLTIGHTSITSQFGIGAECGPIQMDVGTKEKIRVYYDVVFEGNSMKVVDAEFKLDDDNWNVSAPETVEPKGFGVTAKRVSKGLVSGLKKNQHNVENIIREQSPLFLMLLERDLVAKNSGSTTTPKELAPREELARNRKPADSTKPDPRIRRAMRETLRLLISAI